jgi:lipoate-protein ligase A
MIADVKQRVTSIQNILERDVEVEELRSALEDGFSEALDVDLVKGELTFEEKSTAKRLAEIKYSTDDWNFSR